MAHTLKLQCREETNLGVLSFEISIDSNWVII